MREKCVSKDKRFWRSWNAFDKEIFSQICDHFQSIIERFKISNYAIIATSIYGLPFASVLSYKLDKPLILFCRSVNNPLDFEPGIGEDDLKNVDNFFFIDDLIDVGVTTTIAENKLKEKNKKVVGRLFLYSNKSPEEMEKLKIYSILSIGDLHEK